MRFFDLHYHVAPDLFARRHTALEAARLLKTLDGAAVLKSHLGSTAASVRILREEGFPVWASHVLNACAGGIDYRAVLVSLAELGADANNPLLVFFPTLTGHGAKPRRNQIPGHPALASLRVEGVRLAENGALKPQVLDIVRLARDHPVRLATGHADADEIALLGEACEKAGVDRLLVTHPAHPCTGLDSGRLQELSRRGLFWFEQTALTRELGLQDEEDFRRVLSAVPRVLFTSDFGQIFNPSIGEWFDRFNALFASWGWDGARSRDLFCGNALRFMAFG